MVPNMSLIDSTFASHTLPVQDDLLETGKAGAGPYFYSQLYLGLYAEAKGDEATARKRAWVVESHICKQIYVYICAFGELLQVIDSESV
jgi:hypothetical protein